MTQRSISKWAIIGSAVVAVLVVIGVWRWRSDHGRLRAEEAPVESTHPALVELATDLPDTLRFTEQGIKRLNVQTTEARPAPPPDPLRLPGSILLDPNLLLRIHSRFPGEVMRIGTTVDASLGIGPDGKPRSRGLRYGDRVRKNQILATIWSKDIGEKKSELIDAISKRDADQSKLDRYKSVEKGIISLSQIVDATRNVESDLIAVARAERTLLSWKITPDELAAVYQEAKDVQRRTEIDKDLAKSWAEMEVRAAFDGVIVEKNFNVGDIVDSTQDMFKIADLSHVLVLANAYEEDLPALRALRQDQRIWKIDVKADPHDVPIPGRFDRIGSIVDPSQHSAAIMGSLDNADGRLSVGQFITATIDLPPDQDLVAIPTGALIEEGDNAAVLVETNASRHEFTRRQVSVVRRGRLQAHIRGVPTPADRYDGDEPLRAGEHVIITGVLELAAQLDDLKADAVQQRQIALEQQQDATRKQTEAAKAGN